MCKHFFYFPTVETPDARLCKSVRSSSFSIGVHTLAREIIMSDFYFFHRETSSLREQIDEIRIAEILRSRPYRKRVCTFSRNRRFIFIFA